MTDVPYRKRYYWDTAIWGDIPREAWNRTQPEQPPPNLAGRIPVSSVLCAACHRPLAQTLADAGEQWHVNCGPARRPMT